MSTSTNSEFGIGSEQMRGVERKGRFGERHAFIISVALFVRIISLRFDLRALALF